VTQQGDFHSKNYNPNLLTKVNDSLPLMNLFSDDHMSYEIDRDPATQPALSEMADKALKLLSHATRNSDKGFFLLIEGSRIDMAGHTNDPATHVQEILAYQKTVEVVKKFVDENPSTVMISVSDHETGGLSVAHQLGPEYPEYRWYIFSLHFMCMYQQD
jgi:alkaline phosphatase